MKTLTIPEKEWNSEKGIYESTCLPEWQAYYKKLEQHEKFIEDYRFFLDRILNHLNWLTLPGTAWTTDEIRNAIIREIEKASSMDAPNKPGYTRANND